MNKSTLKILVVDDEAPIRDFIQMGLEIEGYQVLTAEDGLKALKMVDSDQPDLVVLDVMLPGYNGFEVCTEIKRTRSTPIIMLTAKDETDDIVRGLQLGADDYLVKPFTFKELSARIHARLRHTCGSLNQVKVVGSFLIDDRAHEITYQGERLQLSLTEYKLLDILVSNKGLVLSKQTLIEKVWGPDFVGDDNIVEVYVKTLRKKIGDRDFSVITTVRGVGYKVVIQQ